MTESKDQSWPNKFPWGAILAAVIVWAVDSFVLESRGTWDLLAERMTKEHPMEQGVVSDRVELARVRAERGTRPLVAVMGSSRAHAGIHMYLLAKEVPDVELAGLAHAGMNPYEIRGAMDHVLPLQPSLVVLLLSEFDTHRPLRLMPQTAPGSFRAVRELGAFVGFPFVWQHRTTFLQVGLASFLSSYRYREVFSVAGLADYRIFLRPGGRRGQGVMKIPFLLGGEPQQHVVIVDELAKLATIYPHLSDRARRAGMTQCRSITRGPHALAQMDLIANAVAAVRAGGGQVLLVEGPLAPATRGFYDLSIRQEFLAFVDGLRRFDGVHFLSLEETGPFEQELFADLTHLGKQGALKMSAAVGKRVAEILGEVGD